MGSVKPLVIDLFCGLGGWTEGFLAEGYNVVGFDNQRHVYGDQKYPGQLVLQDVLTLDGRQFRNAAVIVASPPCTEYSYMAMPWSRGKQIARALRGEDEFPAKYTGSRTIEELNRLFCACFRIASEAGVPLVVENVKGAGPWVGQAKVHFGSFYLWGDINSVGGAIAGPVPKFGELIRAKKRGTGGKRNPDGTEHPQGSWFKIADSKERGGRKGPGGDWFQDGRQGQDACAEGLKVPMNFHEHEKTGKPGRSFQSVAVDGVKSSGLNWSGHGEPGYRPQGFNVKNFGWNNTPMRRGNSRSDSRKAASAQIAKIPFPLAQHIARIFKP